MFMNENLGSKKANYALQHVTTDSWCLVDEECLESFMTEVLIIQKPVQWFAEQINGLVSIRQGLPSWKSWCFATCTYSSRYITWLWQNKTVETFNTRKTCKAYIDFGIFSLCFIVVICKNFRFASLLRFTGTTTNYKLFL